MDYQHPKHALNKLDPLAQILANEWLKDWRETLKHWETHRTLLEKYKRIERQGELLNQMKKEATFEWQFPKKFLASAMAIPSLDQDRQYFDLLECWKKMRMDHAKQCQAWIIA